MREFSLRNQFDRSGVIFFFLHCGKSVCLASAGLLFRVPFRVALLPDDGSDLVLPGHDSSLM